MGIRLYQVDAFTSKPFAGNPAAVCILTDSHPDAWMQSVAHEMNLSETAFVRQRDDGFDLRWFTPLLEVDLCGHATLATAHVLWEAGIARADEQLSFHTRSGVLHARQLGEWIELDFPASRVEPSACNIDLVEALAVRPVFVGMSDFDYLVEIESPQELRDLCPNIELIRQADARGLIVTSPSDREEYDFLSRFFAPQSGVHEDPVTGSAHCSLAPHWGDKLGKEEMLAYQASPRGGEVRVRLDGTRVHLGGQAVTVMKAELL